MNICEFDFMKLQNFIDDSLKSKNYMLVSKNNGTYVLKIKVVDDFISCLVNYFMTHKNYIIYDLTGFHFEINNNYYDNDNFFFLYRELSKYEYDKYLQI